MARSSTTSVSGSSLAERYAIALYAHAEESGQLDRTVEQMAALSRLIDESPDLQRLLETPLINVHEARRAALVVLAEQGFGKILHDFVGVVASNRRLGALRAIVSAFAALEAARRGVMVAHVASAHPLSELQRVQLAARLTEAGFGNVHFVETADPALLGGLVVKIGAQLYDTSLQSRLQRLQHAMKGTA